MAFFKNQHPFSSWRYRYTWTRGKTTWSCCALSCVDYFRAWLWPCGSPFSE